MAIAGFTDGKYSLSGEPKLMPSPEEYYKEKIPAAELATIMEDCRARGVSCHDALMERVGWPAIPYDGQLLVSHQDALLMGGKVQAAPGYADHVRFIYPDFCAWCVAKMCIEMCSGQAITAGAGGNLRTTAQGNRAQGGLNFAWPTQLSRFQITGRLLGHSGFRPIGERLMRRRKRGILIDVQDHRDAA